MNVFRTIILSLILAGFAAPGWAQTWQRTYGGDKAESFRGIYRTADNGYLITGHTNSFPSGTQNDVYLVKVDQDGDLQWDANYGFSDRDEFGRSLYPSADGNFVIGGSAVFNNVNHAYLVKVDPFGDLIWQTYSEVDSVFGWDVVEKPGLGHFMVGNKINLDGAGGLESNGFLFKVDSTGMESWNVEFGGSNYDEARAIGLTTDQNLIIAGFTYANPVAGYQAFLRKTTDEGQEIWWKMYGDTLSEFVYDMAVCPDSGYILTGRILTNGATADDIWIVKVDQAGNETWNTSISLPGYQHAYSVVPTPDGGYFLTGYTQESISSQRDLFMLKINGQGQQIWWRKFGGSEGDVGNVIDVAPDNSGIIAGFTYSFGSGDSDAYLLRTDTLGEVFNQWICGNIYVDHDLDCLNADSDPGVSGALIALKNDQATYFTTSDSLGNFCIALDSGLYQVFLPAVASYWDHCQDTIMVSLATTGDTTIADFGLQAGLDCPLMQVQVSTPLLRRCYENTYTIQYSNQGPVMAENAFVKVDLDPFFQILNVDRAYTMQGNTMWFDLDTVDVFESGQIILDLILSCDSTITGQTHCVEAHIYPDSICEPIDPNWDYSSIAVEGRCEGDSVLFRIYNQGDSSTSQALEYIIIEDVIVLLDGNVTLDPQEDTIFSVFSNGGTWRLEAEQSQGHPGESQPSVMVEGCGSWPFPTGYVIQYPMDDADPFKDIECRESISSFDPNDKMGIPLGYGMAHYIQPHTDIEYVIRFQNTGNDTAFYVMIRDTLSDWLDPASVRIDGASHAFEFKHLEENILKFTFPGIELPDSNANVMGSQGFVKFRISQRNDVPLGTTISNSASIYFDFNAPVQTNFTEHTIGENFILIDTISTDILSPEKTDYSLRVFPNPFHELTRFEINKSFEEAAFELFDVHGRPLSQQRFNSTTLQFEKAHLSKGVYVFKITIDQVHTFSGKIVIQ